MRLFRVLLHLYPASFRVEYGEELCALFARRRRDASNSLAIVALWIEAFFDTLSNAVPVHWDILRQDLRYAARALLHNPGFALTGVVVSALGIGATTAAFSVTDHVLIRPLPFAGTERLVKLWEDQSPKGYTEMEPSTANYRDWKRMSGSFEAMEACFTIDANMVGGQLPERVEGAQVTAGMFPMLGIAPLLGRNFAPGEDRYGAPAIIILSEGLWRRRFAADLDVLGHKVLLDDVPYLVVGVMPGAVSFPSRSQQFWTPMRLPESAFADRADNFLEVFAKLRPGVSIERARAEMRLVSLQLARTYPKENSHVRVTINRLRDEVSQRSRLLLTALLAASFCVLLIACANLANLLLARALARRKELAVRVALGGRDRLVRQLLTESLLLSLAGASLGVLVALAALPLLSRLVPNSLPIAETPPVDWRMLSFVGAMAVITGIGFGVVPALRACGAAHSSGLREGSRGGVGGRKERLRSILVIAEVTGSVVLLVSSGLLIRALWRIEAVDPGFRADGVLTLRTALPMPRYARTAERAQFYARVLSETRSLPGVAGAAYTSSLPMVWGGGIWHVAVEGRPPDAAQLRDASLRFVTPGYFEVMGISVFQGRDVSESDTAEKPFAAVVSDSFVRKYWPGQNPLGRRFEFGLAMREVVGVVADVRVRGLERTSEPQVYLPYRQVADGDLVYYAPKDLAVKSSLDSAALTPALRRIIGNANPELPVTDIRPLADVVDADSAPRQVQVRVLGAFAAIAFLLAGIGLHGLLSFAVSSRAQEFGVRMALGAQRGDILAMVLRDGFSLAMAGVLAGVALAYAAGRLLESLLAGVKPGDAPTFLAAVALCLLMTAGGSLLPAIRAVRVDPVAAMRE